MSIEFFESTIPHDKTIRVVVVSDEGDTHELRFGAEVPRSYIVEKIPSLIPKASRRVKRKAVK